MTLVIKAIVLFLSVTLVTSTGSRLEKGCRKLCGDYYGNGIHIDGDGSEDHSISMNGSKANWLMADSMSPSMSEGPQSKGRSLTVGGAISCRASLEYPHCWEDQCAKVHGGSICPDNWPACACRKFTNTGEVYGEDSVWRCVKPGCPTSPKKKPIDQCTHTRCDSGVGGY